MFPPVASVVPTVCAALSLALLRFSFVWTLQMAAWCREAPS
jgi:hypothetical protein